MKIKIISGTFGHREKGKGPIIPVNADYPDPIEVENSRAKELIAAKVAVAVEAEEKSEPEGPYIGLKKKELTELIEERGLEAPKSATVSDLIQILEENDLTNLQNEEETEEQGEDGPEINPLDQVL